MLAENRLRAGRLAGRSDALSVMRFFLPLVLVVAATTSTAHPEAGPHRFPLGAAGLYVYGQPQEFTFDFGHGFTRIEEIWIDWSGSVTPGTCWNLGQAFTCTPPFVAFMDAPEYDYWLAVSTTNPFDEEIPLAPSENGLEYFLRSGAGSLVIYLDSMVFTDGGVIVPPIGELIRAELVIVGDPASANCGDGWIDHLEYCDDGNLDPGDGCDQLCDVEPFHVCEGEPSICVDSAVGVRAIAPIRGTDVIVDREGNAVVASGDVVQVTPEGEVSMILDWSSPGPLGRLTDADSLASDPSGNLFVAERHSFSGDQVFKLTPDGELSEVLDDSGDGVTSLGNPNALNTDAAGNLYVSGDSVLYRVAPDLAATVLIDETGDSIHPLTGWAGQAAVDDDGNVYVAGYLSRNVFQIIPDGTISQILDGTGSGYSILGPRDIVVSESGLPYLVDYSHVLALHPDGSVSELLGPGGDGQSNPFEGGRALALGPDGKLYAAGGLSDNVFEIDVGGSGGVREIIGPSGDGVGHGLDAPYGVAVGEDGVVYVVSRFGDDMFQIVLAEPVPEPAEWLLLAAGVGFLGLLHRFHERH